VEKEGTEKPDLEKKKGDKMEKVERRKRTSARWGGEVRSTIKTSKESAKEKVEKRKNYLAEGSKKEPDPGRARVGVGWGGNID